MTYPCGVIRDLTPLFLDGVCCDESRAAVEQHLAECADCKAFFDSIKDGENRNLSDETSCERQKARSFAAIRKKILSGKIVAAAVSAAVLICAAILTPFLLNMNEKAVVYDESVLQVSMIDGSLVGRISGTVPSTVHIKRVETADGTYLFFSVYDRLWNELITDKKAFSERVLCPEDRGAETIDKVYYYTGDDTGLESLSEEEMQKVIDEAQLVWSKG